MNTRKTIISWAESRFSYLKAAFEIDIQDFPFAPPFLFTETTGAGYCVTIKPVSSPTLANISATCPPPQSTAVPPQLSFWIPESGSHGTYVTFRDGDEEILTRSIEWTDEEALRETLSSVLTKFLRDQILWPAIEQWLESKAIAFEEYRIHTVSGIDPEDEKKWSFLFPRAEPIIGAEPCDQPDWSTSRVIGLTGDGRAALFSYSRHEVDPRGYVDHINLEIEASGIDSPADLLAWLEENHAVTAH